MRFVVKVTYGYAEKKLEDAQKAFRYMAAAKHIGKIVVSHKDSGKKSDLIRSDCTYLVTGGMGALGQKVAQWLAEKGVGQLVLVGRRGSQDRKDPAIRRLSEILGPGLIIASVDVSDENQVDVLLSEIRRSLPPLRGIIHAAGVLDDGILIEQNWERFCRVRL